MPLLKCADIEIYYETGGDGAPILFISGLGGGAWTWYNQIPYFRQGFTTIAFDNRGAGRSGKPPGPYAMKQFAADALCLLDSLSIDRTHVVGLSMGGMIAIELALTAPDRVVALALGCTHFGGASRVPPSPRVMGILMNKAGRTQEQIVDDNIPIFLSETCRREHPEVTDAYRKVLVSAPPQPDYAFRAQIDAIMNFDRSNRVHDLRAPAIVVTGTEDLIVPKQNAVALARSIPRAELIEIEGAGHALHAECGEKLNTIYHDFFTRVDMGKAP